MVGSAFTLSLIGLGAVQALPAGKHVEERQGGIIIGDGTGIFIPGGGEVTLPPCLVDAPINEQPPCFLPPITGGLRPPTPPGADEEAGGAKVRVKRQISIGDGTGIFVPGQGSLPICLTTVPISQQPPCMLPPISGGLIPPTPIIPRDQPSLILPPDYASNPKKVIEKLQKDLVALQNKRHKTAADLKQIEALKAALYYLAGITNISAPPGSGTTFTPGKRGFILPPDHASNPKKVIEKLEIDLIKLQNKPHKTRQDLEDIKAIKEALRYLAGIISISAPPGTGSTFTPGKRDTGFSLDAVGTYAAVCPGIEGAQIALQTLMHKDKHTVEERIIMQKLAAFLKGCGITIVKSPDGTYTIIKPSDKKRDVSLEEFDLAGLEAAYDELLQAAAEAGQPSFANWLVLQHVADLLDIYSADPVDRSAEGIAQVLSTLGHPRAKRQAETITVGTRTCQVADIMGLRAALAALLVAYGDPAQSPTSIFLVQQVIVSALQLCGQTVAGWTSLVPGSPIPGGPMVPEVTIPGGPMKPDPTIPGGPMKPSTRDVVEERQAPGLSDATAMLQALKVLEEEYGTYGSGTIPVPVWLIMVNLVTILQTIPGVTVPGWPVLGQGSVVLTPST
ncbi:hypothetical protein MFIFM68171_08925 [Madurella fahalii]|uniref:Uncharacterized protein n=1 Tax=Madurella fahalii TaxID=1157608 RepID=A0ABQ0GLX2_9PEZI